MARESGSIPLVFIMESQLWGIIFFLIALLIGMAAVSVHYRKKYEEIKEEFALIDIEERREEIREAREELRRIHEKQSTKLFEIVSKIDKTLEVLEKN